MQDAHGHRKQSLFGLYGIYNHNGYDYKCHTMEGISTTLQLLLYVTQLYVMGDVVCDTVVSHG